MIQVGSLDLFKGFICYLSLSGSRFVVPKTQLAPYGMKIVELPNIQVPLPLDSKSPSVY